MLVSYHQPPSSPSRHRRGTVTVIVVAFLALFAVLGLTFLIASQRFSTTTRMNREAMNKERDIPPQGDLIFQQALGNLIFDVPNTDTGVYNGIRGHSLGRLIYGRNEATINTLAYSGIGRKRDNMLPASVTSSLFGMPSSVPDYNFINYTYFPKDNFIRDPEIAGPNAGVRVSSTPGTPPDPSTAPRGAGDTYWPINANYTAPDNNNAYLAVIDPDTGKVIMPSFHRPAAFAQGYGAWNPTTDPWALNPANPNWNSKVGRYLMLRPRKADHSAAFPDPTQNTDGTYGDVENLSGKVGGQQMDSFWMDLDLPVGYWKGRRYKPLVAFLVTDLDNRININTAGNLRNINGTPQQGSNQGWGAWEVSPTNLIGITDMSRILLGANVPPLPNPASKPINGRYGDPMQTADAMKYPRPGYFQKLYTTYAAHNSATNTKGEKFNSEPPGGYMPHFYSKVDFDGSANNFGDPRATAPAAGSSMQPHNAFINFGAAMTAPGNHSPNNRFQNGVGYERLNHPLVQNPYFMSTTNSPTPGTQARAFPASEMLYLSNKFNMTPDYGVTHPISATPTQNKLLLSDLAKLSTSLGTANAGNLRSRITTISNDWDRPGGTPWLRSTTPASVFQATPPYIVPSSTGTGAQNFSPVLPGNVGGNTGDYDGGLRSLVGVLGGVDLNRPLTDYRADLTLPYSTANLAPAAQITRADQDRQLLASDIFNRLRHATGVVDPSTLNLGNPPELQQFNAARMLAQLSVNIVDYLDNDDYVTTFQWNNKQSTFADNTGNITPTTANQSFVFGQELPRLVINEVLARLVNDPTEADYTSGAMMRRAQKPYKVRVWAELHNPLTPPSNFDVGTLSDNGSAVLHDNSIGSIYRIKLAKGTPTVVNQLFDPSNVAGELANTDLLNQTPATLNSSFDSPVMAVSPNIGGAYQNSASQTAFYIAGPEEVPSETTRATLPGGSGVKMHGRFDRLTYDVNSTGGMPGLEPSAALTDAQWNPTVILQRLLNEHLAPSATNPYITVDVFSYGNYAGAPNPYQVDTTANPSPPTILQDHVEFTPTVDRISTMAVPEYRTVFSFGRRQPFEGRMDANSGLQYRQAPAEWTGNNDIRHTFNRHNGTQVNGDPDPTLANETLQRPFTPAIHADRMIASNMEILNVSAFPPSFYGHMFKLNPTTGKHGYQIDWLSDSTRLFRALDLLRTKSRYTGMSFGGRVPGKVNINTLNDAQVFSSLTNAHELGTLSGRNYTGTDVGNLWTNIQTMKNYNPTNLLTGQIKPITGSMTPILDTSDPQYPLGSGVNNTIPGVFNVAGISPQSRQELMETVLPNLTTRSNTFAIYATVGFFEVTNAGPYDQFNRPILGAELLNPDGKPTRYKYFSVVDRTKLTEDRVTGFKQAMAPVIFSHEVITYGNGTPINVNPGDPEPNGSDGFTISIPGGTSGVYDGVPYTINANSRFVLNYNPDLGLGFGGLPGGNVFTNPATGITEVGPLSFGVGPNNQTLVTFSTGIQKRGSSVLLLNPNPAITAGQPGNPRVVSTTPPDLKSPQYKDLVPVFERID